MYRENGIRHPHLPEERAYQHILRSKNWCKTGQLTGVLLSLVHQTKSEGITTLLRRLLKFRGRIGQFSDEGELKSSAGQNPGGIKRWDNSFFLAHEERQLSATKDYAVTAAILEVLNHLLEIEKGLNATLAAHKLIEDDVVDVFLMHRRGPYQTKSEMSELFRIDWTANKKFCSRKSQIAEATAARFLADFFSNMQPGQRGTGHDIRERLMNGVIRTDQKIGAGALKSIGRSQDEFGNLLPVFGFDPLHVAGQRNGVQSEFRMIMSAHQRLGLKADRAIAERRAFSAATNNADMLHSI